MTHKRSTRAARAMYPWHGSHGLQAPLGQSLIATSLIYTRNTGSARASRIPGVTRYHLWGHHKQHHTTIKPPTPPRYAGGSPGGPYGGDGVGLLIASPRSPRTTEHHCCQCAGGRLASVDGRFTAFTSTTASPVGLAWRSNRVQHCGAGGTGTTGYTRVTRATWGTRATLWPRSLLKPSPTGSHP